MPSRPHETPAQDPFNHLLRHSFGLDAVRAAAILAVLLAHGLTFLRDIVTHSGFDRMGLAYVTGMLGVELFFCLSGYLIGNILLGIQRGRIGMGDLWRFFVRRWMRTLPLYYVVLALLVLFPTLDPNGPSEPWSYAVMGQNLIGPMPASNWFGPSWSLTIEEWSYLILPALAFLMQRWTRQPVLAAALGLCALGIALRLSVALGDVSWTVSSWDNLLRKTVMTRLDAIAYGVVTAYLVRSHGRVVMPWLRRLFPVSLLMVLANILLIYDTATLSQTYGRYLVFSWVAVSFCMIIPVMAELSAPAWLASPVRFVAQISYALYLCHWSVMLVVKQYLPTIAGFPVFLLVSLAASALLSYAIEQPVMRMRPAQKPDKTPRDGLAAEAMTAPGRASQ